MNYNNMLKFKKIVFIAFFLYLFVIYFIYQDNKNSEINNEKTNLQDVLIQTKAIRKYVSNDQKDEIYELQKKGIVSYHYFTSPLLSSTYSANKVNEYYNEFKKSLNLPPIDIRFASPNPRNPSNMTSKEEKKILDQFIDGKINSYETIKKTKNGDILYLALPTRKLEAKCMKCHDTPEIAPKQLVDMYGDTAGFGEKEGTIKALMSIEKPLNEAYKKAFNQTFKSAIYILIATLIFVYFYYNFNKKIYLKNKELEKLNKNLDIKVKERTTELNNSKIQLLNVINSSELGYWDWEINTKKLFVNDIWLDMIGIKKEDFNDTISEWFDKIHPEDFQYVTSTIDNAFKKEISFSIEYRIKHINNNYIWVECVGGVVQRDSNGKVIQACGIHRNIDEKKSNENIVKEQELLIQNQARVASMGEMLKNISHQWKQPLSIITTVASTMKLSYEFNQPMKNKEIIEFSEKILDNGNYLAKIINDFASYFDNNIQKKEELNLANTVNKIVNMMRSEIDSIRYITDVDEELFLYINENFFTQALLNIINNSHDAFNINSIEEKHKFIFISAKKIESNIVINIKDSAGGIEENIVNKIFEPYFTTKHQSLGTGIGLYMTNQIISKHLKGTITVKNSEYQFEEKQLKGCEFTIIVSS
ncbi:DUF3365 domain-containing protein [Halarcobacter sp.]|uniref:c-type heme family protein n=1 Tax=Halarcobacter sp. TaxID=2321133 RepID=UPI0029F5415D|nr:DUF3365 domain-containing protein [Halarcobacter sp.]